MYLYTYVYINIYIHIYVYVCAYVCRIVYVCKYIHIYFFFITRTVFKNIIKLFKIFNTRIFRTYMQRKRFSPTSDGSFPLATPERP